MKISLAWLGDFLSQPISAQAAADALTNAGFPVESIETHGSDTVLDVEVTNNRGDCLSHVGIARELSAILDTPLSHPPIDAPESNDPAAAAVRARIDAPELCPHYTARLIRGVQVRPSPAWMTDRLQAVGVRPINNLVDVTNYVMMELGQPLHAFDFAKVTAGQIIVRSAQRGESIVNIDGRKRELTPSMLVIADAQRPIALAGVMGGMETEVSAATVDVLLESARFDPLSVRRTARFLAMKSESSYRFERAIDPALPARASLRAAQLILQTAGGQLTKGIIQAGSDRIETKTLTLRLSQIRRILGVDLPPAEVVAVFTRLNLSPVLRSDRIEVTVPTYRLDIREEIDLVEEAARVLGYQRIPTREEISIRLTPPDPDWITHEAICGLLVGGGYFEAITFSFVADLLRNDFGPAPLRADSSVRKSDAALRPSLIPGLLHAIRFNETNGNAAARLFEIGSVFPPGPDGKADEHRTVAWVGGDLRQVRGMAEAMLARLDADRPVKVIPESHPGFAKGAGGRVVWGDQTVGFLGQLDPSVADKLSLRDIPAVAELRLAPLLSGSRPVPQLHPLPRFPAVRRDVSFIVPDNLRFEKIDSLIRALKLEFLESIDFVTTYRGKPLEAGSKSVTITLVYRSPDATLTSERVETSVQKVIEAAKQQLGAALRT
ncbi:MAG TPA: phenylalanine--tRNA ligase subunit beta [Tepidisphaeraceae bacterium]|jgi:phenylalanyl-tRNA synthetase beta chain|nr:phenylalanine--tRNA ligase subunit beta [Tepidisphaeraceae bacterium]